VDRLGFVAEIVARFLMPGRDPAGFVMTAVIGIVGALTGGSPGRVADWNAAGAPVGFLTAFVGASALLAIDRAISGAPAASPVVALRRRGLRHNVVPAPSWTSVSSCSGAMGSSLGHRHVIHVRHSDALPR
jgi:uncharacterized membrane protein YeaQ/YmgE (transglycosylase-associated protein family)